MIQILFLQYFLQDIQLQMIYGFESEGKKEKELRLFVKKVEMERNKRQKALISMNQMTRTKRRILTTWVIWSRWRRAKVSRCNREAPIRRQWRDVNGQQRKQKAKVWKMFGENYRLLFYSKSSNLSWKQKALYHFFVGKWHFMVRHHKTIDTGRCYL